MTTIAVNGAAGRMGRRLMALAQEDPRLEVVAALERRGHAQLGRDAGDVAGVGEIGMPLVERWSQKPDVLIDFSAPAATRSALGLCREEGVAMVVGTTGLSEADHAAIDQAAQRVAVLQAANFSRVVNVLRILAMQAARMLGEDYDIEVLEAHHRFKKDAPSGTALMLSRAVCEVTGRDPEHDVVLARHGDHVPRQPNQITVQTLRLGDAPGEHTLYFAAPGERLELRHQANSRDSYVRGALAAAAWLHARPPGRYSMEDVLGLQHAE